MSELNYSVTIREVSKELTAKERVAIKDTGDCIKLGVQAETETIVIHPDFWATLDVHNDGAKDDKDYVQYVIVDKDGTKYCTGSTSFYDAFMNIVSEMTGSDEEYGIKVYSLPSKNRAGKSFVTCSIC